MLLSRHSKTGLDITEETREEKRNKFGGTKYVYPPSLMKTMRAFFEREIAAHLPQSHILYWT